MCCVECGHIFNYLTDMEKADLKNYYNTEYTLSNAYSQTKKMDDVRIENSIKFIDGAEPIIYVDQVLEHELDLNAFFEKIKKGLNPNSYLYIGVPDILRYEKYDFFNPYWVIMREHIHHFDKFHVELLAKKHGFKLVKSMEDSLPLMNDVMLMPNLQLLFQYDGDTNISNIPSSSLSALFSIAMYLKNSAARIQHIVDNILKDKIIYFWGASRELLFIYPFFKEFLNKKIIDNNEYKQKNLTLDGNTIHDESLLHNLEKNSVVVITATAHSKILTEKLRNEFDYKGDILKI